MVLTGDESNRGFSQQFAFSLDFWWLYLYYLGVLSATAAVLAGAVPLTAAALLLRRVIRTARENAPAPSAPRPRDSEMAQTL